MTVFLGGLPCASSTVLAALLNQNPNFHVSPTSPLLELVMAARRARTNSDDMRALDKNTIDEKMKNLLSGMIHNWYNDRTESICFDKCRGWAGNYPLLEALMDSPKIIVPIRDIRGVISSMECRSRRNPTMQTYRGKNARGGITLQGRVESYLSTPPVGIAMDWLFEAVQSGAISNMLVVRAEDLGANPEVELRRIYTYLGIKWFGEHEYEGLESAPEEHDHIHAPYGDHSVRGVVQPPAEAWHEVLGSGVSSDIKTRCKWFYETFYPERI